MKCVATRIDIDERKRRVAHHQVAGVQHVGLAPIKRSIAIGMTAPGKHRFDLVAVEVKSHSVVVGNNGQSLRSGRRDITKPRLGPGDEPYANGLMRQDRRGLAEILVAAAVIEMPVSVDQKAHRRGTHGGHRGDDLVGQRGKLIVDQDGAVGPVRNPDVAARAKQHCDAGSQRLGLDFDLRKIRCLRRNGHACSK